MPEEWPDLIAPGWSGWSTHDQNVCRIGVRLVDQQALKKLAMDFVILNWIAHTSVFYLFLFCLHGFVLYDYP